MGTVHIYGASDDLIEIEGDIQEEFNPGYDEVKDGTALLAFSDGTLLRVRYDGMWRFTPVLRGSAGYSKLEATDEDKNYSDKVTLMGDIRWVVYGTAVARPTKTAALAPDSAPEGGR